MVCSPGQNTIQMDLLRSHSETRTSRDLGGVSSPVPRVRQFGGTDAHLSGICTIHVSQNELHVSRAHEENEAACRYSEKNASRTEN
mmetsp:Transcript_41650/g.48576  ORF Transcript_41650/g.48576 Transcript_41650/m.48576 type:complete len:86 (+) Transcript_41650:440-697(+)